MFRKTGSSLFLVALFAFSAGCGGGGGEDGDDWNPVFVPGSGGRTFSSSGLVIGSVPASEAPLQSIFTKYVDVLGVHVFATADSPDDKVLHAAAVLAQFLDNNEDGDVDNPLVIDWMVSCRAALIIAKDDPSMEALFDSHGETLDAYYSLALFCTEIHTEGSSQANGFDATLEEVLHLISDTGYAKAYPSVFGCMAGSQMMNAMDVARGGQFLTPPWPTPYPSTAWYSYDDNTADYGTMGTEYFYWALTSIMGVQEYPGRYDQIQHEWKANTEAKMQSMDPTMHALLTDVTYIVPQILPDGGYQD